MKCVRLIFLAQKRWPNVTHDMSPVCFGAVSSVIVPVGGQTSFQSIKRCTCVTTDLIRF
ncbi:Uncharacterized protein APZ42_014972 [Daphnia magna]|uniref:Uncharacterized protein n=1 Tax=Daphnia magna TaxID=35525 RepID=A0A162P2D6_9CRUS|nr:Uncharacterized protein APZ42_014972 [Daphnia magna]